MAGDRFPVDRTAILTTHFGDLAWVHVLISRIRAVFPELRGERIYVIDQDRTESSELTLSRRLGDVTILRFPPSAPHFAATGHDHAHVLNLAVPAIDADYLLVFDSDAHPLDGRIRPALAGLLGETDAVLASRMSGTEVRACFMAFGPRVDRSRLVFDDGQIERGLMTGATLYEQLTRMGLRAELLRPQPAFGGRWGALFLDGGIYHHGSGSFAAADDPRLQTKARYWRRESDFFKTRALAGRYRLSFAESVWAATLAERRQATERALAIAQRVLGERLRARMKVALRVGGR